MDYKKYVKICKDHFRPTESVSLVGDASKAQKILGWKPTKNFDQFVEEMVKNDIEILESSI